MQMWGLLVQKGEAASSQMRFPLFFNVKNNTEELLVARVLVTSTQQIHTR